MAIYHLHTQSISRGDGRSIVAAVAYRAAEKLHDARLGVEFDYGRKLGVTYSEIMAPENAPAWMRERGSLWNGADAAENRKDARMGREVRVALPVELNREEQIAALREFVQEHFVSRGMVADFSVHHDNPSNPHAHIMLTTRGLEPNAEGEMAFGKKCRAWNDKQLCLKWREGWANHCNRALQHAGHDIRVDHRSYAEQGIALEPTVHVGKDAARAARDVHGYVTQERIAENDRVMRQNGDAIIDNPAIALDAITRQRATFTRSDVGRFLHTRTVDAEQFSQALSAVMGNVSVMKLHVRDAVGNERFTTIEVRAMERAMLDRTAKLHAQEHHRVQRQHVAQAQGARRLSGEQREAVQHVLEPSGIAVVEGYAGTGKSTMLDAAREAWSASGYHVQGAALSGKAAEGLEQSAGMPSRTLASLEKAWQRGDERLTHKSVLVIDEAGMVGTAQMARVLGRAHEAQAKVVLVGDTHQLQAIEAGAPMRAIGDAVGRASLENIRRQQVDWQRQASMALARGDTASGLQAYDERGHVHMCRDNTEAMRAMAAAWEQGRQQDAGAQVMLAFRRDEVAVLNQLAREARQASGELGREATVRTDAGDKAFAEGERVYFLRNDRNLGVKNGSLGTIEQLRDGHMVVALDGEDGRAAGRDGRRVSFDTRQYAALDYGYAATVHRAQGVTVERAYVLGSELYDRNVTNVALTRHRGGAEVFLSREMAADKTQAFAAMGKERPKDMVLDYDAVARANDQMQRETAARQEEQRREREAAREDKAAQLAQKAGDKEGRDKRMGEHTKLEGQRNRALRTMEQGRTSEKDVWRELPAVSAAAHDLQHAKYVVGEYRRQMNSFAREHPYKAALGLTPKMYERYGQGGGEQRLHEHLRTAEGKLAKTSAAWDKVCARGDLRAEAAERAHAQNDRYKTAAQKLPDIERSLRSREPQHAADSRERLQEHRLEHERSRERDRGMGFER